MVVYKVIAEQYELNKLRPQWQLLIIWRQYFIV